MTTTPRKMTRAEMDADRRRCFAAMAKMIAMGWHHDCSVMDDCGTGGLFYSKGDRRFVMNNDTIDSLPTD